jgi:hypothetical protein
MAIGLLEPNGAIQLYLMSHKCLPSTLKASKPKVTHANVCEGQEGNRSEQRGLRSDKGVVRSVIT